MAERELVLQPEASLQSQYGLAAVGEEHADAEGLGKLKEDSGRRRTQRGHGKCVGRRREDWLLEERW